MNDKRPKLKVENKKAWSYGRLLRAFLFIGNNQKDDKEKDWISLIVEGRNAPVRRLKSARQAKSVRQILIESLSILYTRKSDKQKREKILKQLSETFENELDDDALQKGKALLYAQLTRIAEIRQERRDRFLKEYGANTSTARDRREGDGRDGETETVSSSDDTQDDEIGEHKRDDAVRRSIPKPSSILNSINSPTEPSKALDSTRREVFLKTCRRILGLSAALLGVGLLAAWLYSHAVYQTDTDMIIADLESFMANQTMSERLQRYGVQTIDTARGPAILIERIGKELCVNVAWHLKSRGLVYVDRRPINGLSIADTQYLCDARDETSEVIWIPEN